METLRNESDLRRPSTHRSAARMSCLEPSAKSETVNAQNRLTGYATSSLCSLICSTETKMPLAENEHQPIDSADSK